MKSSAGYLTLNVVLTLFWVSPAAAVSCGVRADYVNTTYSNDACPSPPHNGFVMTKTWYVQFRDGAAYYFYVADAGASRTWSDFFLARLPLARTLVGLDC